MKNVKLISLSLSLLPLRPKQINNRQLENRYKQQNMVGVGNRPQQQQQQQPQSQSMGQHHNVPTMSKGIEELGESGVILVPHPDQEIEAFTNAQTASALEHLIPRSEGHGQRVLLHAIGGWLCVFFATHIQIGLFS